MDTMAGSNTTVRRAARAIVLVAVLASMIVVGCSSSESNEISRSAATYRGTRATLTNSSSQVLFVTGGGRDTPYPEHTTWSIDPEGSVEISEPGGNWLGGSVLFHIWWGNPLSQLIIVSMFNAEFSNGLTVWRQIPPIRYYNDDTRTPFKNWDYVVPLTQPDYNGSWSQTFGDMTLSVKRNGWDNEYYLWAVTVS
jgi:hypothetical protein